MVTIHKSIDIDAPAERVFEMLTDPKRLPEYVLGLVSVEGIRQTEQHIGDSFRATYSVLGLHFPMTFTATEYEPPTKLIRRFEGGMKGTWTWLLEPRGKSTHLTTAMEYEMAGGILGKAMNAALVERMNEKNAKRMLENLKMVSEATQATG
jgi:carbon monoxide dehydrogenase subunit G